MKITDNFPNVGTLAHVVLGRTATPAPSKPGMGQTDVMSGLAKTANHLSVTPTAAPRLSLKPNGVPRGAFDGAWWPYSTDPAIELTALIEALAAQRAPVRRIALIMTGWDSAPCRLRLDSGRRIAVDWFRTGNMRIIRIADTNNQRMDLLLVPVDTKQAIAHLALTMATNGQDPDITASVALTPRPRQPWPTKAASGITVAKTQCHLA